MFQKEIDRDIKGVVKVGQNNEQVMKPELDEYVVTNELRGYFGDFFTAYQKGIVGHTDKMGVWISGFFGSGKSHFLKILSYLLENRTIDSKPAVNYFDDKMEDAMVLAEMKQAGDISTDVILFNIDSKSDSDAKSDKEAIVKVFMKVFNEKQGFCGSIPWLADLERQMVKDGTYEAFKGEFKTIAGKEWAEAREDLFFEEDAILQALVNTTKMSLEAAQKWYNKAEENYNYSLSIETFAKRVRDYMQNKGKNHHLVFLVDEIGQYIGDSSQLMLNLQTVTEDLGTLCGGKVWVIVTSQQDLDAVIKTKGIGSNTKDIDFSKIQGRFNTRITLSSANVDEVIKKRILAKTLTAKSSLELLYQQKSSILKNLITFSADTAEMKNYAHEEDFVNVYPFIPYQFHLLQSVFTGIRIHGASGKSLSEGERSLLSAFQESAIRYAEDEMGVLVPFSAFYETIEAFLDSNIRTVISHAEQNTRLFPQDIELLKLLFLIKYPKEMPSTMENMATLLLRHVDEDKLDRKKQIEDSLKRLIRETLIQKNGEEYVFLTHEEQDVNKEIKNMRVDGADVLQKVGDILFAEIYPDKKFKYSNRYDFAFNTLLDDRARGAQNNEMGIQIITPYYEGSMDITQQGFKLLSARENNVIVRLQGTTAFLEEVEEALKIQAYLRLKSGSTISQAIEDIKTRKARETSKRFERAKLMMEEGLKTAEIYVSSQLLEIKDKNPVERLNDAFRVLVDTLYHKINYIKAFVETDKELYDILQQQTVQLSLIENDSNKLAVDEIDEHIGRNTTRNIPVTVRSAITLFSKAPYGWREKDISAILLKLFKMQEIRLQYNSEYIAVNDKDSINYLTKRDYTEKVLIKKREKIPPKLINNVKTLCKDLFNYSSLPGDEDSLMERFKDFVGNEISLIRELLVRYEKVNYPGKKIMVEGRQAFEKIIHIKDVKVFFEKANELNDDFIDYEEGAEVVKTFFKNQKKYFDDALEKIAIFDANKTYVLDEQAIAIIGQIKSIIQQEKPYGNIPKLPGLIEEFSQRFVELLEVECKPVREVIDGDWQKVKAEVNQYEFKDQLLGKFNTLFNDLLTRIDGANNFYEAIAMKEESDRIKLRCFTDISREIEKRERMANIEKQKTTGVVNEVSKKAEYVARKTVNVSINNMLHGANTIENQADIERMLSGIRKRLEAELKENIIIKLV